MTQTLLIVLFEVLNWHLLMAFLREHPNILFYRFDQNNSLILSATNVRICDYHAKNINGGIMFPP